MVHYWGPSLRTVSLSLACFLALLAGATIDRPTEAEWQPFHTAITQKDQTIRPQLEQFLVGRTWPEGYIQLADLDRQASDWTASFSHAREALSQLGKLNRKDAESERLLAAAAWLAIHSANQLKRFDTAEALVQRFGDRPDPTGEVAYRASQTAIGTGDIALAQQRIVAAKKFASSNDHTVPDAFHAHDARVSQIAANAELDPATRLRLLKASLSLYQSVSDRLQMPAIWFNQAKIARQLAAMEPSDQQAHLEVALEALRHTLKNDYNDIDARFMHGLVSLDLGDAIAAYNSFNTAVQSYLADQRTASAWMAATALRGRGAALLQLAEQDPDAYDHDQAVADLERAQLMGEDTDDLYNNLLVGYLAQQRMRPGHDPDLQAKIDTIIEQHGEIIEPVNVALSFIKRATVILDADDQQLLRDGYDAATTASALLARALEVDPDQADSWAKDPIDNPSAWRWLGHAHSLRARLAQAAAEAGYLSYAEQAWQQAFAAWQIAGDQGDRLAQNHYLAYASQHSPGAGYQAACHMLAWRGFVDRKAWATAVTTYGASQRWKHPLHLGVWGGLILLCLLMSLKARLQAASGGTASYMREESDAQPQKKAPEAQGAGGPKTLLPNSMVKAPKRNQALERRPSENVALTRAQEEAVRKARFDTTQSYEPGQSPGNDNNAGLAPKVERQAMANVARRLAREQQQTPSDDENPSIRRRSPRPRSRRR